MLGILGLAAVSGAAIGMTSVALGENGLERVTATVRSFEISSGMRRARDPQPGDHWNGCNDARGAGTAPIYRGEPGYREGLDGDSDGIACEPYRP